MNITFLSTLIFACGFFGVWFIGEFVVHQGPTWRGLAVGVALILISLALSVGFVKIG